MTVRRTSLALGALFLLILVVFWVWPRAQQDQAEVHPTQRPKTVRIVSPARPVQEVDDPTTLIEAAQGLHGITLRNRVCGLCADGRLDEEAACAKCQGEHLGRVQVDLIGSDGRPIPTFDGMIHTDCSNRMSMNSGTLDLPAGPCTLYPIRVEGALAVRGTPVEVIVIEGEEIYQLLEVPAEPHGGVGITLLSTDDGFEVTGLIRETAAAQLDLPIGSVLLSIDGTPLEGVEQDDVLDLLVGPRGTDVKMQVREPDGAEHTYQLDRREIRGNQLPLTPGLPG